MLVSTDRYRVSREALASELYVDRPLNRAEREAFEHTPGWREYASADGSAGLAVAFDVAVDELGGEENICAG